MKEKPDYSNKGTLQFVAITMVAMILWTAISSYLEAGWKTGIIGFFAVYIAMLIYSFAKERVLFQEIILFTTIAGFIELAADNWVVNGINSLVYPTEPSFIASPIYMPFAWAMALIQLGYIGHFLLKRWNKWLASISVAILGGIYIPLYEHLAKDAGWWWYHDTVPKIFNAPVYVIIGEAMVSLVLPITFVWVQKIKMQWKLVLGLALGLWIWISVATGYLIAG